MARAVEDRAGTLAELLSLGKADLAQATQGWKAGAAALLTRELASNRGALGMVDDTTDSKHRSFSVSQQLRLTNGHAELPLSLPDEEQDAAVRPRSVRRQEAGAAQSAMSALLDKPALPKRCAGTWSGLRG